MRKVENIVEVILGCSAEKMSSQYSGRGVGGVEILQQIQRDALSVTRSYQKKNFEHSSHIKKKNIHEICLHQF